MRHVLGENKMAHQTYLYIVFSSTPFKMGKMIRFVNRFNYNHVSISLDGGLNMLYSFARHYKTAPFYGGFVKEACLRYKNADSYANIEVCALPISDIQQDKIHNYLTNMDQNSNLYVYNMLSAIGTVLGKKVKMQHAFTCVEFITDLLEKCDIGVGTDTNNYYTIKDIFDKVCGYSVYGGSVTKYLSDSGWQEDTFPLEKSLFSRARLTLGSNKRLLKYWRHERHVKHGIAS